MSKRKLSKQQERRIKDNEIERMLNSEAADEGLLVAHFGAYVDIQSGDGAVHRCTLRQNLPKLVVGDRVIWEPAEHGMGVVTAQLPRETELLRPDSRGGLKPVAANIDQIIIVFAVVPEVSLFLLDSYLLAAELTGIKPIIVINKIDLLDEAESLSLKDSMSIYESIGYTVCLVSSEKENNLTMLQSLMKDKCSVFVGQSGVGKSSLIQHLVPNEALAVGSVSEKNALGRHTTTTSRLYHLKEGGAVIDSPGVREFGLGEVSREQVLSGFVDLSSLDGECKYRNCRHDKEPGCALQSALNAGKISPSRMESFQKLLDEIEEKESGKY